MTARLDVTPKTTKHNRTVRSGKSEAEVTTNKYIGDATKAAARQSPNCIKNTKNKLWRKTIFNMADGIIIHPAMWHDHDIDFGR